LSIEEAAGGFLRVNWAGSLSVDTAPIADDAFWTAGLLYDYLSPNTFAQDLYSLPNGFSSFRGSVVNNLNVVSSSGAMWSAQPELNADYNRVSGGGAGFGLRDRVGISAESWLYVDFLNPYVKGDTVDVTGYAVYDTPFASWMLDPTYEFTFKLGDASSPTQTIRAAASSAVPEPASFFGVVGVIFAGFLCRKRRAL